MMLYTKYESFGPFSFGQEEFWKKLVGDHPGIMPVKFGQNPMNGLRGEDVSK